MVTIYGSFHRFSLCHESKYGITNDFYKIYCGKVNFRENRKIYHENTFKDLFNVCSISSIQSLVHPFCFCFTVLRSYNTENIQKFLTYLSRDNLSFSGFPTHCISVQSTTVWLHHIVIW